MQDLFLFFRTASFFIPGRAAEGQPGRGLFCFDVVREFKMGKWCFPGQARSVIQLDVSLVFRIPTRGFICVILRTDLLPEKRPFY